MLRDDSNNACGTDYGICWTCVGMQAGAEAVVHRNQVLYGELMGLLNFFVLELLSQRAFRKLKPGKPLSVKFSLEVSEEVLICVSRKLEYRSSYM